MARQHWKLAAIVTVGALVIAVAAITAAVGLHHKATAGKLVDPAAHQAAPKAEAYLGVYTPGVPQSYAGVTAFTTATGVHPNIALYYSGWHEPFQTDFARQATDHGAVPFVQINPNGVTLPGIASGRYDPYLRSYAAAVRAFRRPVILSFGHEMNGFWYAWGHGHASPAAFVAAWRHIVTLFRAQGARNVTWLWTVNIIHQRGGIPSPARWWPGSSYVTWVGIDGYYYKPSSKFAPLFGPTIKAVRALTIRPILIAETGVAPAADQPAKIANLFAGVHAYGLLGFVWFDANNRIQDWRLSGPAAAAFRQQAKVYGQRAAS